MKVECENGDLYITFFRESPRGGVMLNDKKKYIAKQMLYAAGWWRNERPAGRGRDEDEDEEIGQRLHQLMPLTDKEPT